MITGGASGMGLATVHRFLAEGSKIVVADFNEANGQALVDTLPDPSNIRFVKTDVASEADVQAMIDCAHEEFGSVDIVFNNAGVGGAIGPLTETSVSDWDYTFDVLAKGVFLGIKHAAKYMQAHGIEGSIINTASIAGLSGDGGPMIYSAAKAAVISLSQSAVIELAPNKIRVNAICPGFIVTPLAAAGNPDIETSFSGGQPCLKPAEVRTLPVRRCFWRAMIQGLSPENILWLTVD